MIEADFKVFNLQQKFKTYFRDIVRNLIITEMKTHEEKIHLCMIILLDCMRTI